MNEQLIAAIVAAIIGFLTNVVIKRIEKEYTKEDKQKIAVETAEKSLGILQKTLETVREQNICLEAELEAVKKENKKYKSIINNIMKKLSEDDRISVELMMEDRDA